MLRFPSIVIAFQQKMVGRGERGDTQTGNYNRILIVLVRCVIAVMETETGHCGSTWKGLHIKKLSEGTVA